MTDSQSIIIIREQLRGQALARRDALPDHLRIAFSQLIKKRTLELLKELKVQSVHCYLSFRSEVETISLARTLEDEGLEVAAPVVVTKEGDLLMEHYLLTEEMATGFYGLPEPMRIVPANISAIQAVIVPIVSFDGTGMRLGYGKGFYDRFLSTLDPTVTKIGLAFSMQEVDVIPRMEHDQILNYIITENATVECAA